MPLWLHVALRVALPLPWAAAWSAGYGWLCVALLADTRFDGWGWVVFAAVVLGVGVFALAFRSVRWILRLFPVRCRDCGGRARLARRGAAGGEYACAECATAFASPWSPAQMSSGLLTAALGLAFVGVPIVAEDVRGAAAALPSAIGAGLLLVGVGIAGGRPLHDRIVAAMPWVARVPWAPLLGGTTATAIGVGFVCVGVFAEDESSMPSGRGAVIAGGCAFALVGLCLLLALVADHVRGAMRLLVRRLGVVAAVLLLLSFAATPILIGAHDIGTAAAHPVPWIAGAVVLLLLGVVAYVALRDRRRRRGVAPRPEPPPGEGPRDESAAP